MSSERCAMYCATFFPCQPARPPRIGRLARPAPLLRRSSSCMSTTLSASTYCVCPGPGFTACALSLNAVSQQVVVEEEESWRELAFGETQFGIDQRTVRIDVEIGDACQLARLLPAAKPVAGRHEGQLPVELLQGRPWQAFDERFAVVALAALAHDQEMTRRRESVFERLAPDDFDGIGLDPVPCRDATACDIRGRKLHDGPKNGHRNGGRFAHDEGS